MNKDGEIDDPIVAHTERVVKTSEAAAEWDAATRPPTQEMFTLVPDPSD